MIQNLLVVHQPEKASEIEELHRLSHLQETLVVQFTGPDNVFYRF
jgi:hypothetical protein